jgi:hypothetical protein
VAALRGFARALIATMPDPIRQLSTEHRHGAVGRLGARLPAPVRAGLEGCNVVAILLACRRTRRPSGWCQGSAGEHLTGE